MRRTFVYRDRHEQTGRPLKHPVIATILHDWWLAGIHYAHVELSRRIEHGVKCCVTMVSGPIKTAKDGKK